MPGLIRIAVASALLFVALVSGASAQTSSQTSTWPNRPIRLMVPYPPGGAVDLIARLYGQGLTVRLGQPVVIENRPGSGGNLAATPSRMRRPTATRCCKAPTMCS